MPAAATRAPFYLRLQVIDRPGTLAKITQILAARKASIEAIWQAESAPARPVSIAILLHEDRARNRRGVFARGAKNPRRYRRGENFPDRKTEMKIGVVESRRACLPLPKRAVAVSLGEGQTPLLPLPRLSARAGLRLFAKFEGTNPTGSFKDRGMAVAVTAAKAAGARVVVCASTGNTAAAAAAYAARAGMACAVLIPDGKIAAGKLAQAVAHGAVVARIDGNFDDAMALVAGLEKTGDVAVVNSINPMRLQGQKSAAFEIIEQMRRAPDFHALPVGNAGNISAHWMGYCEAKGRAAPLCPHCAGRDCPFWRSRPRAAIAQNVGLPSRGRGAVRAWAAGAKSETIATAIRIGVPQSFAQARAAVAESGGWFGAVSDRQILRARKALAQIEGIFCEPASAASVAGAMRDAKKIGDGKTVVCTLTGHGLKDPQIIDAESILRKTPALRADKKSFAAFLARLQKTPRR